MWQRGERLHITAPLQHKIGLGTIKISSSHPVLLLIPPSDFNFFFIFFTFSQADVNCSLFAHRWGTASVPDLEEAVPGSCAARHAICRYSNTAHSVVVTSQSSWTTHIHTHKRNIIRCSTGNHSVTVPVLCWDVFSLSTLISTTLILLLTLTSEHISSTEIFLLEALNDSNAEYLLLYEMLNA